ncbi:hypothetical protein Mapa_007598 [Marchantia paleacea]|nr:hypothetical protein Mapa_007598 [Marchantia paleacea]
MLLWFPPYIYIWKRRLYIVVKDQKATLLQPDSVVKSNHARKAAREFLLYLTCLFESC